MRIIRDCLKCYVFLNIIHAALFFYLALIYPSGLCRMKFVIITPCFVQQQYLWNITIKPAVGCYNIQANKCHLGCSPLWDRTIRPFWTNSVKLIYIYIMIFIKENAFENIGKMSAILFRPPICQQKAQPSSLAHTIYSQYRLLLWRSLQDPGGWINIKMPSYQFRKCHCGDKTILWTSYLHNGICYTGKMTSLYWIRALEDWFP